MSRSSFGDVLPLVCGPALVLFGLEILWASSTHLALPLSPYYFVPSLFLLILAAAGLAGPLGDLRGSDDVYEHTNAMLFQKIRCCDATVIHVPV